MRAVIDRLISWVGLLLAAALLVAGGLLTWANTFIGDQVKQQFGQQGITMPAGGALDALPKADADQLRKFAGTQLDNGPKAKAYANHFIAAHMREAGDLLLQFTKAGGITSLPATGGGSPAALPTEMNYANASTIASAVTAAAKTATDPATAAFLNALASGTLDEQTVTAAATAATNAGHADQAKELTDLATANLQGGATVSGISDTRTNTFFTGNTLRGLLLYGYAFATIGTIAGIAAIAAFIGGGLMLILGILGFWHADQSRKSRKAAKAAA